MNKATLCLENDSDAECPNDMECNWKLHSFSTRHNSYTDPDMFLRVEYTEEETGNYRSKYTGVLDSNGRQIIVQEPIVHEVRSFHPIDDELAAKLDSGLAFMLSYYEHGGCAWSLKGEGQQCRFDSVDMAGILIWSHPEDEIGAKTWDERANDARGFLKEYNAWANGECYGYNMEDEEGGDIDSCWGFYDDDYMFDDNITPALKTFMDENGLTKIEMRDEDDDNDEEEPKTLYLTVRGEAAWLAEYKSLMPAVKQVA